MKLVIPASATMRRAGIQFVLAVALTGCFGSAPPLPDDINYRLQLAPATQRFEAPRIAGLVVVERPTAAAVYSSRDVVYSEAAPHVNLQHYHYHHWADPPPQLLQQGLVDHLRSANLAPNVSLEAGRLLPAYRVSGVVRRFERQRNGSGWQAAVSLELRADPAGGREPLLLRQYETVIAAEGDGMEATVQAFARATGTLFDKFVADLNQALPAAEPTTARP
jgi:ABC-type uncharacterized transport system auxiliary subunit